MTNDVFYPEQDELGMIGACLTGSIDTCADALSDVRSDWLLNDSLRLTFDVLRGMVQENRHPSLKELGKEWKKTYGQLPMP